MKRLLALVAACGGAAHPAATKPATLADCAWLQGTWHADALDSHWQLIDGALWGIALDAQGGFEVNYIDDSDEDGKPAPIALVSMVGGRDPMRLALRAASPTRLDFADIAGRAVTVTKTASGWRGAFTQPGQAAAAFDVQPGKLASTDELTAADREFAADTAAHGADGWSSHFTGDGVMWRPGQRIEGAGIREAIAQTFARGMLRWQPVAAGARGDTGFTLGTYTFNDHHGSYATIWKKQPDGSWKVLFDIGRPGG